jgi:glycine cleavage system H protein
MVEVPDDLLYSKDHEWARIEGKTATVGITDYAQQQLGDLTHVELPDPGDHFNQFDEVSVIDSVKASSDIYTPITGTVTEVNSALSSRPEAINTDPYGDGWIFRMDIVEEPEEGSLLSPAAYDHLIDSEDE